MTAARDLQPGDLIDVPADAVVNTDNEQIQPFEYGQVESVNGGWADHLAGPGEVVVYLPNFASPVVLAADRDIETHAG